MGRIWDLYIALHRQQHHSEKRLAFRHCRDGQTWESSWTEQPSWCSGWGCSDTPGPAGVSLPLRSAQWCCAPRSYCCLGSHSWCGPPGCWSWTKTKTSLHQSFKRRQSVWFFLWRFTSNLKATYTIHGTPPIRTLTSLGCPVLRLRPLIVRGEPPALGPLRGEMLLSTGSWKRSRRREIKHEKHGEEDGTSNQQSYSLCVIYWGDKRGTRAFWETREGELPPSHIVLQLICLSPRPIN